MSVTVQAIGGPTAVVVYAGLRFLTDPTFDPPHETPVGRVKYTGPVVTADDVEPIDAVLLSHDHHHDNLDDAGRAFLPRAARVFTTRDGAARLANGAVGLAPFETADLTAPDGRSVRITATPAEHGPSEIVAENGPVIGFVLQADELPALYVSGDNASVDVVKAIAARLGTIPATILFTGAASVPDIAGGAPLTLTADRAVAATLALGARTVIPVHHDGWSHYSEDADDLRRAFSAAGLAERLLVPELGATLTVAGS